MPGRPMASRLGPDDRRKAAVGRRPADRARRNFKRFLAAMALAAASSVSAAVTDAVWSRGAEATEAYWNAYVASCIHRTEHKR